MSVTNPRYKLVNFRLSVGEYQNVFIACHAEGVRTVSEFARTSVLSRAQREQTGNVELVHRLMALLDELTKLSQSAADILSRLENEQKKNALEY